MKSTVPGADTPKDALINLIVMLAYAGIHGPRF